MKHLPSVLTRSLQGALLAAVSAALASYGITLHVDPQLTGLAALLGGTFAGTWSGITIHLEIRRNGD